MVDTIYDVRDNIAIVTLNRPDKLNSVTMDQLTTLAGQLIAYEQDDAIRAVVITATGRGFCTGADLSGAGGRRDAHIAIGMKLSAHIYSRVSQTIASIEKPVIAAVNGIAAGFGCNLALSCDIIYAAEEASFIEIFVRRGMCPDGGGTYFLPRLVGLAKAKELFFTGDALNARDALQLGMINRVVAGDRLMDETLQFALRMAAAPTRSIGMMKRLLNRSFDTDLQTQLDLEAAYQGLATSTEDMKEGVLSFLENRKPAFRGK